MLNAASGHELDITNTLALLEKAFAIAKISVLITDARKPDNPIVYANAAFENQTGYKLAEVMGLNPRFLHGDDSNQAGSMDLGAAVRNRQACVAEMCDYRKDGTPLWVEVTITPIFGGADNDELTHFVGFTRDISDRKELEEERECMVAALAHDLKNPSIGAERVFDYMLAGQMGAMDDEVRETIALLSRANKDTCSGLQSKRTGTAISAILGPH